MVYIGSTLPGLTFWPKSKYVQKNGFPIMCCIGLILGPKVAKGRQSGTQGATKNCIMGNMGRMQAFSIKEYIF